MRRWNYVAAGGVVFVLAGVLFPLIVVVRANQQAVSCANNLRQIGIGLLSYHDANQGFPPGAIPNADLPVEQRLSWFVAIMPYVEAGTPYPMLDQGQAWSADGNASFLARPFPPYTCPTIPREESAGATGRACYVGVAGVGSNAADAPPTDPSVGAFGYERRTRVASAARGASETLMILETRRAAGPWVAGGSATVRGLDPQSQPYLGQDGQFGGLHPWGAGFSSMAPITNALLMDGSARRLAPSLAPSILEKMATLAGKEDLKPIVP